MMAKGRQNKVSIDQRAVRSVAILGEKNITSVIGESDAIAVKRMLSNGASRSRIAETTGVSKSNIGHIARGESWSHINV